MYWVLIFTDSLRTKLKDSKILPHLTELLKQSTKEEDSQDLQEAVMEAFSTFAEKGISGPRSQFLEDLHAAFFEDNVFSSVMALKNSLEPMSLKTLLKTCAQLSTSGNLPFILF
jgi:hypothetical protein